MLTSLAILLSGYSVISAMVLALSHFRSANYPDCPAVRAPGIAFVCALGSIQLCHFGYLYQGLAWVWAWYYPALLFSVAPLFYLFSAPLLSGHAARSAVTWLHALPALISPFLPWRLALPLAFAIGALYLLWLARRLYALREQRRYFRLEILILGAAFGIAASVVVLGLSLPIATDQGFFVFYASAIGCVFILIGLALGLTPRLPLQVAEAVSEAYASTTLANVDCDQALQRLDRLMQEQRIYTDPNTDLAALARQLDLGSHQLSELINTRLGKGFSRYMRERRVQAAQDMLLAQPSASVLSVGLSVGFASQSNFYEAFREITGMTPGKYRKIARQSAPK